MHPAPSVIVFTALSGLGFGLIFWMGLGLPDVSGMVVVAVFATLGLGLATIGLLASTFHLGNPQRAWRAFSQWKTSWLSREGILAVLTLIVFFIYACCWAFLDTRIAALGWLSSALAAGTVFTTSMIYAQMKTVPRWNAHSTTLLFFLYAAAGGALLAAQMQVAGVLLAILAVVQVLAWMQGDGAFSKSGHTIETATGLSGLGKVRLLEKPHSGSNYLMHEMMHVVGRKHSAKLRMISIALTAVIPATLILFSDAGHIIAALVILLHVVGLFVSRWLFFAEAEHVVGLYYDKR
ncbi:MAG: dimethyl sulfoxide reductase anchor subunit [Rhodobacteraceae bacterium]|nr:dimethyl sulfoxide reductase anchor subunit [Paracoccaceae bacterium]